MFTQHSVHAGSIDNANVLQEIGGIVKFKQGVIPQALLALSSITHDGNLVSGGDDAFLQDAAMEQSVDAGRFARVELSHYHQQEEFIQGSCHLAQCRGISIRSFKPEQACLQFAGYLALLL